MTTNPQHPVDHHIDHGDLPEVPEAVSGGHGGGTATVTEDDVTEAMKDVVDGDGGRAAASP